ncbi:response regulator transcription factor [Piscinibacter sp. HJYY11]|uniref:response regulator transcription factor n=1 Tax=Piscinibacter sp. HJYY11 TaxID=2801333 RepID=UPI00191E8942|nr:response regulator transcription factor [Piscinibacter sp. HJYY11]MBL0729879.1 response regulator transcription factor [Piscinibacter sp. HJYY11]
MGQVARVFVIDLRPLIRDGLKARLFTGAGLVVSGEAEDLDDATQRLSDAVADVYLVDAACCSGSHGELASFVERVAPAAVLVLTDKLSTTDFQEFISAGAKGVMRKDAPVDELLAAVSTVFGGGAYFGDDIHAGPASRSDFSVELSPRELEVIRLVGQGLPSKLIAKQLGLSVRTVESHRLNAKKKLRLRTNGELIKFAVEKAQSDGQGKTLDHRLDSR